MRYSQIFTLLVLLTVGTTNAAAVSTVVTTGEELQKAIYTATPEETIYLEAGDYIPPGDYFDVNRSVTIEAYDGPVTIDTSGKTAGFVISAPNVKIDGLNEMTIKSGVYYGIELKGELSSITIRNLVIDCAGNAYRGIYDYGANVSNLTIENVKILHPKFDGVYLYDLIVNGKYYVVRDLFVDRLSVVGAGGKGMYVASVDLAKNITIENSKFSNCSGDGVYLKDFSGSAKIVKTIFLKNPTGLYVSGGSVNFTGNYVADNGVGVSLHLSKFAARGNIVKNNSQYGIYAYRSGISIFNSTFDENGNGDYTYSAAIYLTSGSSGEIHYCNLMPTNKYSIYNAQTNDVNAQKNYWSTTNTTVINGKIYDSNDYAYYGTVYYTPILISPALILPAPVPELFTALLLVAGLAVVFMRRLL